MHFLITAWRHMPLAPFGLPLLVCAPLWSENILKLAFADIVNIVSIMLALTACLLLIVYAFVRNWPRASLITLIWAGYCLYLPTLVRLVTSNVISLLAIIGIGAILALDLSRRVPAGRPAAARANGIANMALAGAVVFTLVPLGIQQYELERGRPDPTKTFKPFSGKADKTSPDVWHIVMDRYAGARTLAATFDMDNTPFLKQLQERGFSVSEDAYSNYHITPLSLASTLNASYLDTYATRIGRTDDLVTMFNAIDRNRAFSFFKRNGYEIIFSGSWADVTVRNSQADQDINFRGVSEVPRIALLHSVPGTLGAVLGMPYTDGRMEQCQRIKHKFNALRDTARARGQKYIFAHFLIPHPPYGMDENGNCLSIEQAQETTRAGAYARLVTYANKQLLDLIDAIRSGPRPAIIVLHADEGPYPRHYANDEPEFPSDTSKAKSWFEAGTANRRQKTNILLAVKHADDAQLTAPRTPVNIYPQILNHAFGANMKMHEDRVLMTRGDLNLFRARDYAGELFDKDAAF